MYGWVIDKDHLTDGHETESSLLNARGLMGPHNIPGHIVDKLNAGEGIKFRIYDDDGELYYEGRYWDDKELDVKLKNTDIFTVPIVATGNDDWFAPLDDFAMPNAGATAIFYQDNEENWGML